MVLSELLLYAWKRPSVVGIDVLTDCKNIDGKTVTHHSNLTHIDGGYSDLQSILSTGLESGGMGWKRRNVLHEDWKHVMATTYVKRCIS